MWSFRIITAVLLPTTTLYICLYTYTSQVAEREGYMNRKALQPRRHMYVIDNPFCKIPDLEPYDTRVQQYFHVQNPRMCSVRPEYTHQRGNILILNIAGLKKFCKGNFTNCEYRTVIRVGDFNQIYSPPISFSGDTVVTSEFIRVKCFCVNKRVYTNFHAFIHAVNTSTNPTKVANDTNTTRLNLKEKVPETLTRNSKPRLNVVMVGVDSISRLNSYRQLSDTRHFLLHELGGVELKGYNKVADNTFVNLVPILLGKYIEDIPWTGKITKQPFDRYDLMWRKYHRQGYRTLYAEDYPSLGTFYLGRKGFVNRPTDHYYRPMSIAIEREKSVWWSGHLCINGRLELQFITQYIFDFIKKYKSDPHFAFSFLTRMSHDNMNLIGVADYVYKGLFQTLHKEQLLNDTLLFFYSDHGIRFGNFRKTTQGRLEERLPMMYIMPPKWFPKRFPRLWENLKTNTQRLTTPFDIHETLKSVLNLEEFEQNLPNIDLNSRGISLFAEVPENRTCKTATIKPHWCTCQQGQKLSVNDSTVLKVAGSIVAHINKLLQPEATKCASLKLDKIHEAVDTQGADYSYTMKVGYRIYQLTLVTKPGMALFETTVKYEAKNNNVDLLGDISRLNKYGSQSSCTSRAELKKLCYCK